MVQSFDCQVTFFTKFALLLHVTSFHELSDGPNRHLQSSPSIVTFENKFYNKLLPESATNIKYFVITEQALIRKEMANAFQIIYNKQDNLDNTEEGIKDFLNSDGDWAPYQKLQNRKIP